MREERPRYLDEDEDILRKNIINACEEIVPEIEEDDFETESLLKHEEMLD